MLVWAMWAHMAATHEHLLPSSNPAAGTANKIYFKNGASFNTAIVAWVLVLASTAYRYFVSGKLAASGGAVDSYYRSAAGSQDMAAASSSVPFSGTAGAYGT